MDLNLFSTGLFVCLSLLIAAGITLLFTRSANKELLQTTGRRKTKKDLAAAKQARRRYLQRMAILVGGTAVLAVGIDLTARALDSADKLPSNLWLMSWPFTICISWLVWYIVRKHAWMAVLAGGTMLAALLLGLLLVNNYYRYYPTLYSVFGIEQREAALASQQTTTLQYTHAPAVKAQSIEQSLYGNDQPAKGVLQSVSIPGKVSGFNTRSGWVYLPPAANNADKINLPVMILMGGVPGSPDSWIGGGDLQGTMDDFAKLHHGITPLVFVVDNLGSGFNDTECVDSPRGNAETYLSVDVPAYIKAHYEVSTDPGQWAIGGLSLGGMCGIMLTLRHADTFHYFLDFGGEDAPEIGSAQKTIDTLFHGSQAAYDAHSPAMLMQKNKYPEIGGFFAIGKNDKLIAVNNLKNLYQQAKDSGINGVIELVGGEHTFGVWKISLKDALPWLSTQLGATQCISNCY